MRHPHELIQLVSEQTMPNVLAALAVRPESVVLLHTKRTRNQVDRIKDALAAAGLSTSWDTGELGDTPTILETGRAVADAIEKARQVKRVPIVNFTGGTKLMSIGAFAACHRTHCPSFYVDTEHGHLHDGHTATLPEMLSDATRNLKSYLGPIPVDVLARAHGVQLSRGRDPSRLLPIAKLLLRDQKLEQESHDWIHSVCPAEHRPRDLLTLVETSLDTIPDRLVEPLYSADAIELRNGHWHFVCPDRDRVRAWAEGKPFDRLEDYHAVYNAIHEVPTLLGGSWWELAVWEAASTSGRFSDLRWSVERSSVGGGVTVEEDLIASDGLQLALFSCKRGGERSHLLRALDELESAGRQLGGIYCSRFLCVARPLRPQYLAEIEARSRQNRITLVAPASRLKPSSFRLE
jgi:hypothetical protein